ncbi:hypothetical protein C8J57DRAFT_1334964 [Mycena rebaudengoi]|nr:hypothetical protein C8J57DRAFT_1334964 [Mycena rebaudengoi]
MKFLPRTLLLSSRTPRTVVPTRISAKQMISTEVAPSKSELHWRWSTYTVRAPRPAPTALHKDWHRPAQPLPAPWHPTSDWEEWEGRYLWLDTLGGIPFVEQMFKTVFAVPGTVEPIAFACDGSDASFVFAADGQYYVYEDGALLLFEGEFASKEDFLQRGLPGHGREEWSAPYHDVPPQPGYEHVSWLPGY